MTSPLLPRLFWLRFNSIALIILTSLVVQHLPAAEPMDDHKGKETKAADPNVTTIDLAIREQQMTFGDRRGAVITVNDTVPGPLVRLREGRDAVIRVTNHLKETTSIHWHGILLPPGMDGVPGVSFAGIKPGETFTYRFPVRQNGTYWYHSHSGVQEQLGLYGALIIDAEKPEPFAYDRDHVIVLSDWTAENPMHLLARLKSRPNYYNFQRRTVGTFMSESANDGFAATMTERLEWGRMRMDPTDIADVTGATYKFLINGMAPETNWTALYRPGEKVRMRFINAAAATYFDLRLPGLKMTVVSVDGQHVQPVTVDEIRIAVAETYDVIVEPTAEQTYAIFAETMDRSGFAFGTLATTAGTRAAMPQRRTRPILTMADMGMGDMAGMKGMAGMKTVAGDNNANAKQHGAADAKHSTPMPDTAKDMGGMDHSAPVSAPAPANGIAPDGMADMPGMKPDVPAAMTGSAVPSDPVPHGPDGHGPGNSSVPMQTKSRLSEPGIGLDNTASRVLLYSDLRSLEPNQDVRPPGREIELHLTGNMERYMWGFDGKTFSEAQPIIFHHGERLRLTLVNDTMMNHPIHLHGMFMELDNGSGIFNPRKHTVNVKPAERLSLNITADELGNWAFHCHILYHMELGMFRIVSVVKK